MVRIVILCAQGMSSSLIKNSVKRAAEAQNLDADVHVQPSLNFKDQNYGEVDVVLLAPQVRGQAPEICEYLKNYDVKVGNIGMYEYGLVKGDVILKQAMDMLKE